MTKRSLSQALNALVALLIATAIFSIAWGIAHQPDGLAALDAPPALSATIPARPPNAPAVPAEKPPALDPETTEAFVDVLEDVAVEDLRERGLLIPVEGVEPTALTGSFDDRRGSSRRHEAIDILAPRHTPVLAVEDGTVARLFLSDAGGITLYQFDPDVRYVYYYAHLERYAPGVVEKGRIARGQVIGYVGTSGNAPKDTPHLHFAIFKLTEHKRWWEGTPIDPFAVLRPGRASRGMT